VSVVAVAAPHGLAVDAARDAVSAGGNALDAALAAAAVLAVVYPHQCSVGGDLSALHRRPDGSVEAVLSLGAAAAAVDVGALAARGSGMPSQGPDAVTVPGVVAGWAALADAGARLGLAPALERAAALAADGVEVAPGLARAIAARHDAVRADPGLSALLLHEDRPVVWLSQPALARTLSALADDPEQFYRGALGARLASGLGALGSRITADDLALHQAETPAALSLDTDHGRWWAAPPPAQGAVALALLDRERADAFPGEEPGDGLLDRARAAHAARSKLLGDPRGGPIDVAGLRHPAAVSRRQPTPRTGARASGDTVAVCAVDDEGRAVALIQSVYQTFGAGLLEPGTGIVLHNRGGAFVLLEDLAAHARHPGRLGPGLRPPHTLCPLLGEADGVQVALGCQGGRAQPLILAQVGPDTLVPDADLAEVLARPRWVIGDRDLGFADETLLAEPGGTPGGVDGLAVVACEGPDDRCGHVSVARRVAGVLAAAADPRADGGAMVSAGPAGDLISHNDAGRT
jgi:gamma-glutamyltranspeptidase